MATNADAPSVGRRAPGGRGVALLLAIVLVLGACGDDSDDARAERVADGEPTGHLVIARGSAIEGWDPGGAFTQLTLNTLQSVMEPLFRVSADGKDVEPGIASSYDLDDSAKQLTITIHDDAAFSDGSPVTSADVAFSLEEWKAGPEYGPFITEIIKSAETPDEQTVVFQLNQVDNDLLPLLAIAAHPVIPENFGNTSKEEFYQKPIGAGPFMIASEVVGDEIVLEANPHYYREGAPRLERVTFKTIADSSQRFIQFRAGDVHIIELVPLEQAGEVASEDLLVADSTFVMYLMPNWQRELVADPAFRQALMYGIDRDEIVDLLRGHARTPASFFGPGGGDIGGDNDWNAHDPERARQLVAESSYNGEELRMVVDGGRGLNVLVAEALQQQLGNIGIRVRVERLETQTFIERWVSERDYDLNVHFTYSFTPSVGDPLRAMSYTEWLFSGAPEDVAVAALDQWRVTASDSTQREILAEVDDWAFENIPFVPLVNPQIAYAVAEGVEGFQPSPLSQYYLDQVAM